MPRLWVAGMGGEISVYPSNDTNLVIDINGYFAPPASDRTGTLHSNAVPGHRHPEDWHRSAVQRDPGSAGGCRAQSVCAAAPAPAAGLRPEREPSYPGSLGISHPVARR